MSKRSARLLVFVVGGVCLVGCSSGLYPTRGTVLLEDGSPLEKGMVVFETTDGMSVARGVVQPDGKYELSTGEPGDGVRPGRYRALISTMDLTDVPDEQKKLPFDVKYTRFQTSGLEFEVKAESNDIPITLKRPAKAAKKN